MKKMLKSKLFAGIVLVATLATAGILWQSAMAARDRQTYSPVGDFVDLGAYAAHYYTAGSGDTTFVFIAGAGIPCAYTDFYFLQQHLCSYGKTISFDHAGLGWSTPTDAPRDTGHLVSELSTLIDHCSSDRVVLICHSLGALEAIGYAQTYPDRVKGIIFLDSGSPAFYSTDAELSAKVMNRSLALVRFVGLNRFLGACGLSLPVYGESDRYKNLPDDLRAVDRAMYNRFAGSWSNYRNIDYINENAETVLAGDRLGAIPILVLSSDSGSAWAQVQAELTAWSDDSRHYTVTNAAHYLYWTNRDEVIAQIDAFIQDCGLLE